ncbi:uncharacterized protein LOC127161081 [Labeo rohita]|uniref:uncharacterized protein LOC127161081 n=1 Tax=Labeo rohita TaxID=84645 RepID=UPI0021E28EF4|nr:uncharacterized protein LOC127161081 [Labeo rohita]
MFDRLLFCLCLWRLAGVFADSDAVKSVSVMEGDSITLQTNTEIKTDDLLTWTSGLSKTLLAQIIKQDGQFFTYDIPDGKFRDRLKLDHQTGSLTITNTRTTDSGLYQVTISGRRQIRHRFNVTVHGVFADSDAVKSVSVMERDSVTLVSGLTEIQTKNGIMWTFGLSETRIAQIYTEAGIFSTFDVLDGKFRDRLKLDHQTGSLTITNTRTTDSGLYEVTISGTTDTTYRFNVTVSGVFVDSDAVKSVSVMEGDLVTLESGLTELQTKDGIMWTFGFLETRIAQINKDTGRFSTFNVLNGKFRDRLKLDHQTGSLTITNTRTTDSGLYQVTISGRRQITYRFNVTVSGVFADLDAVKSVSVMEGDSVTLESGLTELQTKDRIMWTFGLSETRIAQINKQAGRFSTYDGPDGRFRDRLKLDHQTGSLTITNTRTTHSGLYQITISSTTDTKYRFNVTVSGVFADSNAVKSVSVMEGDSVTLQTNTELQTEDLITWTFGLSETRIVQINKDTGRFSTYDVLDGRFRDRLKVDHQTGSLTITNTRTTHSGLYQVTISGTIDITYRFNVFVSDSICGCDSAEAVIRLVVSALVCLLIQMR